MSSVFDVATSGTTVRFWWRTGSSIAVSASSIGSGFGGGFAASPGVGTGGSVGVAPGL